MRLGRRRVVDCDLRFFAVAFEPFFAGFLVRVEGFAGAVRLLEGVEGALRLLVVVGGFDGVLRLLVVGALRFIGS